MVCMVKHILKVVLNSIFNFASWQVLNVNGTASSTTVFGDKVEVIDLSRMGLLMVKHFY